MSFLKTRIPPPPSNAPFKANLYLEAGHPGLVLDIDSASLRAGSVQTHLVGLPPGQGISPGNTGDIRPVEWVYRRDLPARTPAVVTDVMQFLRDTEIAYWNEMHGYLRNELRIAPTITTTAVGYTTSQIAAETADFVDTHRYWGSPRFPNFNRSKPWTVEQKAMVAHPAQSTIERISARRVFGKPFTITEYNHPPSTDHHAEAFPLISVWGAAQGWNGIFQFAYAHGRTWENDTMSGFLDTVPNPAHTIAGIAAADIFRNQRIAPLANAATGYVTLERQLERQNNYAFPRLIESDAIFGELPPNAWLTHRVGLAPTPDYHLDVGRSTLSVERSREAHPLPPPPPGQNLIWDAANPATAHVRYTGDGVAGLVGFVAGKPLDLGWLRINPGTTSLDGFSVVMLNSVDHQPLGAPGRYLLITAVRAANRNMGWNADRTGFGKNWGSGPAQAEAAPIALDFANASGVRVYPLNPDGTRRPKLPPASADNPNQFKTTPADKTLWYEITLP